MSGIQQMLQRLEQAVQSFLPPGGAPVEPSGGRDSLAEALVDVARHYGEHAVAAALKAGLPLVEGRLPLEYVDAAARRAGLLAQPVQASPADLVEMVLPAIVLLADGGADVVWAIERDAAGRPLRFLCSEAGQHALRAHVPVSDLVAAASGRLVRLAPRGALDDRVGGGTAPDGKGWFLAAFADSRRIYAEAIAATVAINLLALAMPLFTMNVYDRVLPNAAAETLWSLAIGVVLATVFDIVIKVLRGRFVDVAGRRADVLLGNLVYGRLIGARMRGAGVSAGVRANTIRELDTLREFYNSATVTAFGDLPFLVLFLGMIGVVAGSLVLIPMAAIPIVLVIAWLTQQGVGRLMAASVRQAAVINAVVVETVAGLESIKAAGAESWAASLWEKATAESIRTGNDIRHYSNVGVLAIHGVQTLTQVVMIVVGFYMAASGALTGGALIAATMLAGRAMQPLSQIATLIARLHQTRLSWQLLDEIVRTPQERPEGTAFVSRATLRGEVVLEGVTHRYEKDGPPVLDGVSFSIGAGEHVGLIGGIGGGKSTALRLVHGLLQPSDGRLLIDGIPVSQLDPALTRARIGLALQQADLFHGTIRSNIMLGDPGATEEALIEAARISCALDWIVRLPKGFETPVRERGAGLSGGQRQTIVLARALLRRPSILLLDEPTSDLDPRTEQTVVERLKPWLRGRTAIVVTHRPAMLALVDRLIVLDAGRKRLDGPKSAVLASLAAATGLATAKDEARR